VFAPEVDYQSLVYYFFYGYTPDPDCLFKDVKKLPPGHTLVWHNDKITINQYWDVEYRVGTIQPEEYYIERSLEIMREAVRIRLMSEVPLGAFLSGGVDSSLVVALMAREMSEPVKTFSIGFEDQSYNELQYARMVADKYETDHHEEVVRPDAEEVILDLVKQFDEPFADSSAIPTYYVSKMTKKWVTVSLSGDGGDELFGGYARYRDGRLSRFSHYVPDVLKKVFMKTVVHNLPFSCPGINTLRYLSLSDDEQIVWKYTKMLSPIHGYIFSR
jgi:asparagine synthase (glutamine-hydrolysing)